MAVYYLEPTQYYNTLGPHPPALHIKPGDTVVTTTVDAWGYDARGQQVTYPPNPQTGPFFVEEAEPEDTLVVHLDRLCPNRERGYSRSVVADPIVEPGFVREIPLGEKAEWQIDALARRITLIQPLTALGPLQLPLVPMLGCFGVAPPGGQAISTATSGPYGGNMDYRGFTEGVTVYFPVFAPGALLFVGDGHAFQADGEILGTGVEVSFEVQFTVDLLKGKTIFWPRGENATHIFTVGNARPLDQAVQHATTEMLRWLQTDYRLDPLSAHLLLGKGVEYEVGNIFDPAYTMVCKLRKDLLPRRG